MSVTIQYAGRLGNHVFQYVCARLFAKDNGLELLTHLDGQGIFKTTPHETGTRCDDPVVMVDGGCPWRSDVFSRRFPLAHYVFSWYFQKERFYLPRRDEIVKFLSPVCPVPEALNTKDIVAHFRLGDYLPVDAIHPDWYLDILKNEKFDRLHIVAEENHERYFSYFKKFDPIIHIKSPAEDWNYLLNFDRFICSSSTFAWWAAFLGKASKVYTHQRWIKRYAGDVELGAFKNGIRVDGPFVDEKSL